jgi:hypothetical protein
MKNLRVPQPYTAGHPSQRNFDLVRDPRMRNIFITISVRITRCNIQKVCISYTECTYGFNTIPRMSIDCFLTQY